MAANNDLIINIAADSKNAVASLAAITSQLDGMNDALDASNSHLKKTEESLSGFGASVIVLNEALELAMKAYEAFEKTFGSAIEKFTEADDVLNNLSNTLQLIGEKDVAGATDRFKEFAESLEATSATSAETILKMVTLAKAMGQTDEMAEMLARSSVNLAVVNHSSVQSTFDTLANTLKGVTRGVQIYDKTIKDLTETQNKAGGAIKIIDDKFDGFAQKALNTIGGQAKLVGVLLEHSLEDIGSVINALLKLGDRHIAIEALTAFNSFIKSLVPTVKAVREAFDDGLTKIENGLSAVNDKAMILIETFAVLAPAIAFVFSTQIIAQITSTWQSIATTSKVVYTLAEAYGAAGLAALPVIAANTAIVAGLVAVGVAVDLLYNNWKQLTAYIFGTATEIKADFGIVGKIIDGAKAYISGYNTEIAKTVEATKDVAKSTAAAGEAAQQLSKDAQQAFDALAKKVEELKLKQTQLGGNIVTIAGQQLALELKQIDIMEAELKARGGLNAAAKVLLQTARDTATANSKLEVFEKQKKALQDLTSKTSDLQLGVDSFGKTQSEIIDLQLANQLKLLDLKQAELDKQGLLTDAVKEQLNAQRGLLEKGAANAKEKAPNPVAESLSMAGEAAGKGITDAFAPLLGATNAVGAYVSAAQAVVDAIPKMLESITHLLDSITELPLLIAKDFGKLLDAFLNLIQNILANLASAILSIFTKAADFFKKLPEVIIKVLQSLPDLIANLLQKLPDILQSLITNLVTYIPKIAIAFIEFFIKSGPKIAISITTTLVPALVKAVVNGIIDGLKEIGSMVKDLLSGKFNIINTKQLEKDMNDVLNKVSASASRVFSVAALTNAAQDASKIKTDIQADVDKSLDKLKAAWAWVMAHIIQPIIEGIKKVFTWVWDHILSPYIEMLRKEFQWIKDHIFDPIFNALKEVFNWVNEKIFKPYFEMLRKEFQWVWDNILSPFVDLLKDCWQILKNVGMFVANLFSSYLTSIKNQFLNLWNTLKNIWNDLMAIFQGKIDLLTGLKKIFGDLFDGINNSLKISFQFFSDTGTAVSKMIQSVIDSLKSVLGDLVGGASKVGENIWNGFKDAMIAGMNIFNQAGQSIWYWVSDGFNKAGDMFNNVGQSIWKGLKSGLDTLEGFFNDLFNKLNPGNLFAKMFNTSGSKGQGTVETTLGIDVPFLNFATGGMVPGQASIPGDSEMNDKIVALLSPGEAIISRSMLSNPAIKALVDAIISGKINPPKFKSGGIASLQAGASKASDAFSNAGTTSDQVMDDIKKGVQVAEDLIKSLDPKQLWEIVRGKANDAVMKMFEANKFSTGGYVGTDTVPAMLTPGEFVLNNKATKNIGLGNLHAMNNGGAAQNVTYNIELNMTIKNDGKDMSPAWVREKIVPTLQEELKKASLKGDFVISKKGIR